MMEEEKFAMLSVTFLKDKVDSFCKKCGKKKLECADCDLYRVAYYLNDNYTKDIGCTAEDVENEILKQIDDWEDE